MTERYQAALSVYTERTHPQQWADTQYNLGLAYYNLPDGDRDVNLRRAIEHYQAALRVYTEQVFPRDWAITQNNLGATYSLLESGDRKANLRQAIEYYQAALRVYTEQAFPQDWAMTQKNLGIAYSVFAFSVLSLEYRDVGLRQAIECYQAALRVITEQTFPKDWAIIQNNVGVTYRNLSTGNRDANLQQAIKCYQAALRIYTEQTFPHQRAQTQYNLALAQDEIGDREAAQVAMRLAVCGYRKADLEGDAQIAEKWLQEH